MPPPILLYNPGQGVCEPIQRWARVGDRLLYCHTLGEVSRLVHIAATHDSDVVRQQLQRDY